MSDNHDRRKFLKKSVVAAIGGAIGSATIAEAAHAQAASINPSAKAILPNGRTLDRAAILQQLGLNPTTPPDAWLAVVGCGVNSSALNLKDREQLMRRGVRLEGGELPTPGGAVPGGAVRTR